MPYTISQVARKFGISRSTLLYYDSIGLLSPGARSESNYRLYSERDVESMEEIARLHGAGVPLADIKAMMGARASQRGATLRKRLSDIAGEMQKLKEQQDIILGLLGNRTVNSPRALTKDQWVECLKVAGLDEDGRDRWHAEFERSSPEAHQAFLESLGIDEEEIKGIRRWSKKYGDKSARRG